MESWRYSLYVQRFFLLMILSTFSCFIHRQDSCFFKASHSQSDRKRNSYFSLTVSLSITQNLPLWRWFFSSCWIFFDFRPSSKWFSIIRTYTCNFHHPFFFHRRFSPNCFFKNSVHLFDSPGLLFWAFWCYLNPSGSNRNLSTALKQQPV